MLSVLIDFGFYVKYSGKTTSILTSLSPSVVFQRFRTLIQILIILTCEKIHKKSLHQRSKNRYRNASFTVEASLAFPVFFFAVWYLLQMFCVLRAELAIAGSAVTAVRETAVYAYAAERLAEGENAMAETLLELFDQKVIRDVAMTGVFYTGCDEEALEQAGVAQGLGGIWVDTEFVDDKTRTTVYYRVEPKNGIVKEKSRYYTLRLVYRNWTGEGGAGSSEKDEEDTETVYMTEHGKVYHTSKNCSYIVRDVVAVYAYEIGTLRNESGAKYYACEFCSPVVNSGTQVYITGYGTRYHRVSSCSAIKRNVKECLLEEVEQTYPACNRCGTKEKGGGT